MKSTNVLLAAFGFMNQALATGIKVHAEYSDKIVDVGSTDLFATTWQKIYASADNGMGVVTDDTYTSYKGSCVSEYDSPNLDVRIEMEGEWGSDGDVNEQEMRDAIIHSMWKVLDTIAQKYHYPVFWDCDGLVWQNSPLYVSDAACGPKTDMSCASPCSSVETPTEAQCMKGSMTEGVKVPSKLVITTYRGTELLSNKLTLQFSSATTQGNGCGIAENVINAALSFVPIAGGLFIQGVDVICNI